MKRRNALVGLTGGLASVVAGCSTMRMITGKKKNPNFKIVGYFPSYRGTPRPEQLAQLTHVIYAFISPTPEGGVNNTIKNLQAMVDAAHKEGTKAGLAIGGGSYRDGIFPTVSENPDLRKKFCENCMKEVDKYKLDGIDLDWEYPNEGPEEEGYELMMGDFAKELHARGGFLSSAVTDNDFPGSIPKGSSVMKDIDLLNVMIYDRGRPHSTYKLAEDSVKTWCDGKGFPREKFMLGVPFYAHIPTQATYAEIVKQFPEAANADAVGGYDYNGKPTIIMKTQLALAQVGGIMIWEIGQDAPGDASLLTTIYNTVRK
jgi:chitinase